MAEKEKREKLIEEENERKLDKLVDLYTEKQQADLFDELLARVVTDSTICESIRDKLVRDEISASASETSNQIRAICASVIEEERQEIKLRERQLKKEIKEKFEVECAETLLNEITGSLMRECCERVIWQLKNERLNSIYDDILDEVLKKMLNQSFLDMVFDEMIVTDKPLIEKPAPIQFVEAVVAEKASLPEKKAYGKRRLSAMQSGSSISQSIDSVVSSASQMMMQSPAKKICTMPSMESDKSGESPIKKSDDLQKAKQDAFQNKYSSETLANLNIKESTFFKIIYLSMYRLLRLKKPTNATS